MTTPPSGPPLAGIRILEISSYVTGPYAAALLCDLGATVTKLEEPTQGDPFRGWGRGGYSPTFRSVNQLDKGPLGDLWRPRYFNGGIAVHGSASVPAYPASHGCARVSNPAMNMIWASGLMPMGSRVVVY